MAEILIIDDDPTIRMVLKRGLERQGHQVRIACDGQEGLEQAQQYLPALIICDWMMPAMDGLQVCRHLKSQVQFSTTFFILLTSRTEVEDRVLGLDAGADEFLAKPIDSNELQARVRAGLRLHELSRDLTKQTQLLQAELAEAAKYVQSLLPPSQLFSEYQIKADWRFIPSQHLGGDCFNYYWLDADHLALYLLDVSGHGVGAALLSVSVMNLLRSATLTQGLFPSLPSTDFAQPASVLASLNDTFQMANQNEMYFTIWYGVYQPQHRQLVYASAGHPPALLVHHGASGSSVQALKTANIPIGMMPNTTFIESVCQLEKDSFLYLFSDGVYEVTNLEGQLWGLLGLNHSLVHPQPSLHPLDQILQEVQQFGGRDSFADDVSLVQIHFGG